MPAFINNTAEAVPPNPLRLLLVAARRGSLVARSLLLHGHGPASPPSLPLPLLRQRPCSLPPERGGVRMSCPSASQRAWRCRTGEDRLIPTESCLMSISGPSLPPPYPPSERQTRACLPSLLLSACAFTSLSPPPGLPPPSSEPVLFMMAGAPCPGHVKY